MSNTEKEVKRTSIGGQALIEGVMMRGPKKTSMAVRHTSGEIVMDSWDNPDTHKSFVWRTPFVRGIFMFVDSLISGYKALMKSVDMSGIGEEEEEEKRKREEKQEAKRKAKLIKKYGEDYVEPEKTEEELAAEQAEKERKQKASDAIFYSVLTVVSTVLGLALGLFLFIWLPIFLYNTLKAAVPFFDKPILQSVFEGILRITIFILYIASTALMKDIRRVYMYHGSEHKTIFCYEHGKELTVENVRKESRFHPRCGTSFMILMLLIGIFFSMIIPTNINSFLRAGIKLLMLPFVMGIGYEAIKLAGRRDNTFTRIISAPGMWVQHITTKEPTDDMIECAIAAFKDVIPENADEDKW